MLAGSKASQGGKICIRSRDFVSKNRYYKFNCFSFFLSYENRELFENCPSKLRTFACEHDIVMHDIGVFVLFASIDVFIYLFIHNHTINFFDKFYP